MIIGCPREIKAQENRVALLPSAAYQLTRRGQTVVIEAGAGLGAGYADDEYRAFVRDPNLLAGLSVFDGRLTCPAVAEAHGIPWSAPGSPGLAA